MDYPISRHPEFRYKTEFQSHEPEVFFSHELLIHRHHYYLVLVSVFKLLILTLCIFFMSVRLPEEFGNRGENQQNQMVPNCQWCPVSPIY